MKCFYHNADLDGLCSGMLVKRAFPECILYGINYGDSFPWSAIEEEDVIMVDYSLQPFSKMLKLRTTAKSLIWFDHHISVIKEQEKSNVYFSGILDSENASCFLVWEYFWGRTTVPVFVELLSDYDNWNNNDIEYWNNKVIPFQYGMRLEAGNVNSKIWFNLLHNKNLVDVIIKNGAIIVEYENKQNEKYMKTCSFASNIDGYRCLTINRGLVNSRVFDTLWDNKEYDFMVSFIFRKGQWAVSIYTDKEDRDASEVAKKYGGGGHKGAAGFQCKNVFDIIGEIK